MSKGVRLLVATLRWIRRVVIVGYFVIMVLVPIHYYYTTIYPIERDVLSHIKMAKSVNDASTIYRELYLAYEALKRYHGNPNWFAPTPATDFDYIRSMLGKQINATKEFIGVDPNDYGYQRFLKNVYYALGEIEDMLKGATAWLWGKPLNIVLAVAYIFVGGYLWLRIISWLDDVEWKYREKYRLY